MELSDAQIAMQLFPGYAEADTGIFAEFANPHAQPEPGFVVDFLGSRIRITSVWKEAQILDGQVMGLPVPGDFHAETIEWIGLLKAVRSADSRFVAMELGAGFGPWAVAGGLAARRRGIPEIRLCAVEADPHHFRFLRQHFLDNAFNPEQHALFEAAVGVERGTANWPVGDPSLASEEWGSRPFDACRDYRGLEFQNVKPIAILPMRELVSREPRWDLVHVDVQGGEVDICRSSLDELGARVRWLVVATHSRKIEGELLELLSRAGWVLEHEKPTRFVFEPDRPTLEAMTTMDGTQVWRNPGLILAGEPLLSFSQELTTPTQSLRMRAGDTVSLPIKARNTGTQPWYGNANRAPVRASYRWFDKDQNALPAEGNRASLTRAVTCPEESDDFELPVLAPGKPGSYSLLISMVQEGVAWFYDKGANPLTLQVTVD